MVRSHANWLNERNVIYLYWTKFIKWNIKVLRFLTKCITHRCTLTLLAPIHPHRSKQHTHNFVLLLFILKLNAVDTCRRNFSGINHKTFVLMQTLPLRSITVSVITTVHTVSPIQTHKNWYYDNFSPVLFRIQNAVTSSNNYAICIQSSNKQAA